MSANNYLSTLQGISCECSPIDNQKELMTIRSSKPLSIKTATVGVGCLQFPTGSAPTNNMLLGFRPFFIRSTRAELTQSTDTTGQFNLIRVEAERFPGSSGFVNLLPTETSYEFSCAITGNALRLEEEDRVTWAFHFNSSPQGSYNFRAGKATLAVRHGSSEVALAVSGESGQELELETSFNGSGYGNVVYVLRRELGDAYCDQPIGQVANTPEKSDTLGSLQSKVSWKPTLRDFDFVFACDTKMNASQFLPFLSGFGPVQSADLAQIRNGKPLGFGGFGNFIVSDGTEVKYTLKMTGHRKIFSDDDETTVALSRNSADA